MFDCQNIILNEKFKESIKGNENYNIEVFCVGEVGWINLGKRWFFIVYIVFLLGLIDNFYSNGVVIIVNRMVEKIILDRFFKW